MTGSAARDPRIERLRAHVAWLADPARAGREVGTAAERMVAEDLARRFAEAGLDPAGTDGYLQPVPLVRARSGPASVTVIGPDGAQWISPVEAVAVRSARFSGSRARGPATLVKLRPPASPLETTSAALRLERLVRELQDRPDRDGPSSAGAPSASIPVVLVEPGDWVEARAGLEAARFRPPGTDDTPDPSDEPPVVILNGGAAPRWLRHPSPRAAVAVEASWTVEIEETTGWNVAGWLRGSDPALAEEAVVLTAHHDHLGVRAGRDRAAPGRGVLYPGVVDNALSVAELVETARSLAAGPRPPRSIVFLSPTAEEVGFFGTRRWLAHPPPGTPRAVANWNHDGASEAWGRAASAVLVAGTGFPLADVFAAVVSKAGLRLAANPFPTEGFFFRSDHYVFAEAGVPAGLVFLGPEYVGTPEGWGVARAAAYLREAYHQPKDGLQQIESWEGALQYVELWAALARASAERAALP